MARKGLVRTFQIARELSEMTVLENLMLAPKGQIGESAIRSVTPGLRGEVVAQEEEIRERAWDPRLLRDRPPRDRTRRQPLRGQRKLRRWRARS